MKTFRYVVVCSNGASFDLAREGGLGPDGLVAEVYHDLPDLLRQGWRPVRETPMGGHGGITIAYALVLLERDAA